MVTTPSFVVVSPRRQRWLEGLSRLGIRPPEFLPPTRAGWVVEMDLPSSHVRTWVRLVVGEEGCTGSLKAERSWWYDRKVTKRADAQLAAVEAQRLAVLLEEEESDPTGRTPKRGGRFRDLDARFPQFPHSGAASLWIMSSRRALSREYRVRVLQGTILRPTQIALRALELARPAIGAPPEEAELFLTKRERERPDSSSP